MRLLRALLSATMAGYLLALILYVLLRLVYGGSFWWLALLNNFAPYYFLPLLAFSGLACLCRLPRALVALPLLLLAGGMVWLMPRFIPSASATSGGPVLKIITFNHWGRHPNPEEVVNWLRAEAADVVMLQQAFDNITDEMRADYPYADVARSWAEMGGRIMLSRHPFLSVADTPATIHGERGWQRAVIAVEGQPVTLYNVHLAQPQRPGPRFRIGRIRFPVSFIAQYDERERNQQIEQLVNQVSAESGPTIIAGDFNTSDNAVIYDRLTAVMQDSFRQTTAGFGATWPVSRLDGLPFVLPLLRIDFIMYRGGVRAASTALGPNLGSDHLPVIASLELHSVTAR